MEAWCTYYFFKKTLTARFVQLYALDTGGKKP